LLKAWRAYSDALSRHEADHVRDAYQGRYLLGNALRAASCSNANAVGQMAIQELKREADVYDGATNHGREEGAMFPPRSTKPRFGLFVSLITALIGGWVVLRQRIRSRRAPVMVAPTS
jgi:Bacterial protein of unknown function (DUF922)